MRTITVCAYNRPEYLEHSLQALSYALNFCPQYRSAKIIVGVDPSAPEIQNKVEELADRWAEKVVWPEHLGVSEAPRRLLQYAFSELGTSFNVHIEDDILISPDALRLCLWFERLSYFDPAWDKRSRILLSLHSHSQTLERPEAVIPRRDFGVWGWACPRFTWNTWIAPYWNHKRTGKIGWDWSVSKTMKDNGLSALCPVLSRSRNIGREGGVHQRPEEFDQEMTGLVAAGVEQMQEVDQFRLQN